jgi:hypothetical protein
MLLSQCLPCGNKEIIDKFIFKILRLNLDHWMLSMIMIKMITILEDTSHNGIWNWGMDQTHDINDMNVWII